jgi:hypothetical protein
MRGRGFLPLVFFLSFTSTTAHAEHISIGANLGVAVYDPENGDSTTIVGWPASQLTYLPGMRIGISDEGFRNEIYFDTGLNLQDKGRLFYLFELTTNYQYAFSPTRMTSPYITAGAGLILARSRSFFGDPEHAIGGALGGGVGFRNRLPNGHGAIRAEVHFDHMFEADPLIAPANLYMLKVGFDLYFK